MEAAEAKVQRVLEGSKQFLVPHYQRPYSWREEQWRALWRDILELLEEPDAKPHFLGSIVTSPARSVPEGVEKRLLIDGQQRLTTLIVLLLAVRNRAREAGGSRLADRIQDLVSNRHEEGNDHHKLLPTQGEDPAESDREAFVRLMVGGELAGKSGIRDAYEFFLGRLQKDGPDLEALFRTITTKLTLVSIILDDKDNPHRIFESLNGKGRPLSQADLIRNYFFMRLHEKEHERVYVDLWRPMQRRLGEEALTDFVRHYLARSGALIRENDLYAALKSRIDADTERSPLDHLRELARYSEYYEVLLHPEKATSPRLRDRLHRLNRLEVTVTYPFLLSVYADWAEGSRTESEFLHVLDALETYLIRRFVCGVPSHGLNKILVPLYEQARRAPDLVSGVKTTLGANPRLHPRDEEFRERLVSERLYGSGDRREKTKLLLERLEAALGHKEVVAPDALTIEHVLPQTLTDEWKAVLGSDWKSDHEQWVHTLGNLTLTSYNPELGNASFAKKRTFFAQSHVELNRYFAAVEHWTTAEIERRAETLADLAIALWPYFGPEQEVLPGQVSRPRSDVANIRGTVPSALRIAGNSVAVQSWVDVGFETLDFVARTDASAFASIVQRLTKFVSFDASTFPRTGRLRRLSNDAYMNVSFDAVNLYRWTREAARIAGLEPGHWEVAYTRPEEQTEAEDPEGAAPDAAPTRLRQLQHEFWGRLRDSLQASGSFPSLQSPGPRHWFDIALGRSGIYLNLSVDSYDEEGVVKVVLQPDKAERGLQLLLEQRELIDRELGITLHWNPHPEKRVKTIKAVRPFNLYEQATWPDGIEWFTRTAIAMYNAFAPRVKQFDFAPPAAGV